MKLIDKVEKIVRQKFSNEAQNRFEAFKKALNGDQLSANEQVMLDEFIQAMHDL